ncbi:MAG: hypothetical protein CVV64_10775 [Candidatus Wallbacteria bacterium HGW-Wallbacteria-1]|jgi:uncharacterized tellurite resistance protein B-like protein|uniref:Co-chaperone DjlA N-terminal domain-containing protein n=1 Tax=Candidatus Wallbacteria bacterium HGW-Wallbacteria-1 TaxID=2013854 RepID=A0A2N1PPD7_9BACT|nr:MAG: hypothetical protein CVV64_10775 [Candidatus Wallbacteria bacterium HGW-Wallbacteria-1]
MEEFTVSPNKISEAYGDGQDPEKLVIESLRTLKGLDSAIIVKFLTVLRETGAVEIAMKILFYLPLNDWRMISETFRAYCQTKFLDLAIPDYFDKLLDQGVYGRAMEFARKVDSSLFEAMEEAGVFDAGLTTENRTMDFSDSFETPIYEQADYSPNNEISSDESLKDETADLDLEILFRTLIETIMADGIITDVEKRFIGDLRRAFNLSGATYSRIFNEVNERWKNGEILVSEDSRPTDIYRKLMKHALADGVITPQEEEILFSVAQTLFIDRDTHLQIMSELSADRES